MEINEKQIYHKYISLRFLIEFVIGVPISYFFIIKNSVWYKFVTNRLILESVGSATRVLLEPRSEEKKERQFEKISEELPRSLSLSPTDSLSPSLCPPSFRPANHRAGPPAPDLAPTRPSPALSLPLRLSAGKGVLIAPFRLIKKNSVGVILTFAVYNKDLPPNATPDERIEGTDGYLGGVFHIESLVEKLLQQLASKQNIVVNVYDTTNWSHPISMYGSDVSEDHLEHVSTLNFGDPFRKHEMLCRFKQKAPWPWLAITTSAGILVIASLVGYIFRATMNRIAKVEDGYHKLTELKKRAEAADVAKSQFLATVSHEIRTPMIGVLGMLHMLMGTDLDETQQDYGRTAQESGKALVSLINEVLDQAKIESGKIEIEAVQFDLRAIVDDVLSLFSGKSQEKGVELAVYISENVPERLIGDPGRFRQIITNLMGNSIKFTEKGHILVTVHLVDEVMNSTDAEMESATRSTWAKFRTFSQEGPASPVPSSFSNPINLIISVEDTGIVCPSISRTHGGTGIGLSINKCMVGLMNGEIGFVSIPQVRSTFTFIAVFNDTCSTSKECKGQQVKGQGDFGSSEFHGMKAVVVDTRPVRANVSKYHIQRLGIHVEVVADLNQCLHTIQSGNCRIDMVLLEWEIWDRDSGLLAIFLDKLRDMKPRVSLWLFLLSNSISSSRMSGATTDATGPFVIMKPLRASMLVASLQCVMGVGNRISCSNGESLSLSLHNLLCGRKILVLDDNKVNLRVAEGALKKYGADVVCTDSGEKTIALVRPSHDFDACFMDIPMPGMDGFEATKRIRQMQQSPSKEFLPGQSSSEPRENISNFHLPILAMTADVIHATREECTKYVSRACRCRLNIHKTAWGHPYVPQFGTHSSAAITYNGNALDNLYPLSALIAFSFLFHDLYALSVFEVVA
ncbi:hypothetical protein ACJRO7_016424 [Eucalyptus globulus]|uniref:histidine kinase n=1 Tax=Eucalyptus globulus TaxID=34317 RepID=A0ABD3L721_EUCGL